MIAASVLAAPLIGFAGDRNIDWDEPRHDLQAAKNGLRMARGRCHDHRFIMNNPTAAFEREIFGI